jgi:hypothetical protein
MVAAPLNREGLLARSDLAGCARVLSVARGAAGAQARLRFLEIVKDDRPRLSRWLPRTVAVRLRKENPSTLGEWTDAGAYRPGGIVMTHLVWDEDSNAYRTAWWNAVWPAEAPNSAFQRLRARLALQSDDGKGQGETGAPPPPAQGVQRAMAEASDLVVVASVTRVERETPAHPLMAELRIARIVKACDSGPPLSEGALCLVRLREYGPWSDKELFRAGETVVANLDWNRSGFGFLVTTSAKSVWRAEKA